MQRGEHPVDPLVVGVDKRNVQDHRHALTRGPFIAHDLATREFTCVPYDVVLGLETLKEEVDNGLRDPVE